MIVKRVGCLGMKGKRGNPRVAKVNKTKEWRFCCVSGGGGVVWCFTFTLRFALL